MVCFIATIFTENNQKKHRYEEYIQLVKPIAESYGGRYLLRSDKITTPHKRWESERIIVIEWDTKEQLQKCFALEEYKKIADKRERSVDSRAIIVEE